MLLTSSLLFLCKEKGACHLRCVSIDKIEVKQKILLPDVHFHFHLLWQNSSPPYIMKESGTRGEAFFMSQLGAKFFQLLVPPPWDSMVQPRLLQTSINYAQRSLFGSVTKPPNYDYEIFCGQIISVHPRYVYCVAEYKRYNHHHAEAFY